ncbi:MAG TPA: chemotaxis protein CheW [Solimonas sp.]
MDLSRFHRTFFEESFEGLDAMESALLKLDPASVDAETINTIFRAAHSIKGGAGTFGFSAVASFTHHVETLLDRVRSGQRQVSREDTDLLLRAVDVMRAMLKAASEGDALDVALIADVQRALERSLDVSAAATAPAAPEATVATTEKPIESGWAIRFVPKPELFASGNDPLRILRELTTLGPAEIDCDTASLPSLREAESDLCYLAWTIRLRGDATRSQVQELFSWVEDECRLEVEPLIAEAIAEVPPDVAADATADATATAAAVAAAIPAAPTPAPATRPALSVVEGGREPRDKAGEGGSIRVGTEKIDALINLVGELVITQAMLMQQAAQLDPVHNERLLQGLSQLDRNTRMLQEAVMSTRMLPMDFVFSRFPRVVRDLAGKLGKQVRLSTIGEHTELDKSVIERIADPLNHLVRNALDHGLESVEARVAAGKDPCGTIRLSASHQGGNILIEVADDGRGLDRERILAKARERGIAVTDGISDAEVWQLIFAPGFSTAATVTDVSGRGVGMDVVKKNIQALGGRVEIATRLGHGMTVSIRLPLTLAILDGMSVRVGSEIFIVPLGAVVESLQPRAEQVKSLAAQGHVIKVRNEYVPLAELATLFGIDGEAREAHDGILVLMEAEGRKIAARVDELVGQQQVVIKSLESNYRRVRGISGATILGDGRVALILDVAALVQLFSMQAQAA